MTVRRIGVGIIGMGMMGQAFAQICTQVFDAKLAGLCDTAEAPGRAAAEQFGVPYSRDWADLISRPEVEAVIVSTPEDAHVAPCVAALQMGKSVLVEKPIADSAVAAEKIIAARKPGAMLLTGHVLRFTTQYALAKQMVDEGQVGSVQNLYTRRLNGKSAQERLKGRCSLPMFLGVHDYDIVRWLAASEPVRVYAESQTGVLSGMGFDVEDTNWALFTFANGVVAVCETGWILPGGHPSGFDGRLAVQGSDGRLDVELLNQTMLYASAERAHYPGTVFMPRVDGQIREAFVHEIEHFLACIRGERELLVTPEDAMMAVRMAEAVQESARTHQPVHFR
jgi:UDP-N-acetylglucosamine 3-dehydrogenase